MVVAHSSEWLATVVSARSAGRCWTDCDVVRADHVITASSAVDDDAVSDVNCANKLYTSISRRAEWKNGKSIKPMRPVDYGWIRIQKVSKELSHSTYMACDAVLLNRQTAIQGHSSSSFVVPIDAVYMTLIALNSNLTSIFNRSWDTTPSLHSHSTPHAPLFQV